jgi:hypothetical protein
MVGQAMDELNATLLAPSRHSLVDKLSPVVAVKDLSELAPKLVPDPVESSFDILLLLEC